MIPVILFSLTLHEYSHGKVASLLGDDTAQRMGRLTFNPLKHLDIMGILFFYFMGFGWAKPVPVDWRNFHDPRRDMMYVAFAGPLANLCLAVACSFFLRMIIPHEYPVLFTALALGLYINVALAIFNMLPIYPLDGSSIIKGLVTRKIAARLGSLDQVSMFILLGIFLLDHFAETHILGLILGMPIFKVVEFLAQDAFSILEQVLMMTFSALRQG